MAVTGGEFFGGEQMAYAAGAPRSNGTGEVSPTLRRSEGSSVVKRSYDNGEVVDLNTSQGIKKLIPNHWPQKRVELITLDFFKRLNRRNCNCRGLIVPKAKREEIQG
jgi:hypothetical protein